MDINDYWTERRTVRKFSEREVPDALLSNLIEKASHAPTTGNMQLYSVIITRDPEARARLTPAPFNQPASTGAPVLLTFCADFNRFVKWCEASGAEPGFNNFQSFMSAVFDTVIFAQQFNTIAELEGLGCCYLGTTSYNAPMIAEALGLPELVVPVLTLSVGYPDGEFAVSDRLPVDAIMHIEKYHDETPEEVRRDYYAYKESLEESAKFVNENEKQTLAQVFTDVRYPRSNNETFSKIYYDFIAQVGFNWPKR